VSSKKGRREDAAPLAVDSIQRPKRGTPEHAKAKDDAVAVQRLILAGDEVGAWSALFASPAAYFSLQSMPHVTNANAKKIAAFLNAHTDRPHRQHGSRVNVPKNPVAVLPPRSVQV